MERDIRLIKDVRNGKKISLNLKFAIVIICAVIGVIIQFVINEYLCELYVEKIYMSESAVLNRDKENIDRFIKYVTKNNVSARSIAGLEDWQEATNYVDVLIFQNNHVIFDTVDSGFEQWESDDSSEADINKSPSDYADIDSDESQTMIESETVDGFEIDEEYYKKYYNFFPVQFRDGTYDVCIIDYSEARMLNHLTFLCFMVSFLTLIIIIILYNKSQMKRIITLTNEVDEIEAYKLDGKITIKGRDEIAYLAADIDDMRKRIIEQLTREQKAWQANSELVTSMAHDIRTPLTVLSGYLELLQNEEVKSDEEKKEYLKLCAEKAEQLKNMSDKMFNFFFVYSKNDYEVTLEEYDADALLTQMFLEYMVLFEEKGFSFDRKSCDEGIVIEVDAGCLKRMMDNIFSNLTKYADKGKPIIIEEIFNRKELHIKIRNSISKDRSNAVSTKVGIKTCRKLAGQMNCRLWTEESSRYYMVHLVIPAKLKE